MSKDIAEENSEHPQMAQYAYKGLMSIIEKEISESMVRHLMVGITFERKKDVLRVGFVCCAVNPYEKEEFDDVMTKVNTEYSDRAFIVVSSIDESKVVMDLYFHIDSMGYAGQAVIINNKGRAEIHFSKMRHAAIGESAIPVNLSDIEGEDGAGESDSLFEIGMDQRTLH